jgi:predicted outer membrane repeat protein
VTVQDDTELRDALGDPFCTTITVSGSLAIENGDLPTIDDTSWGLYEPAIAVTRDDSGLTIKGDLSDGADSIDGDNTWGGIFIAVNDPDVSVTVSTLTMKDFDSQLRPNGATGGAALYVYQQVPSPTELSVRLLDDSFISNSAQRRGGAVHARSLWGVAAVEICSSYFKENSSVYDGGAIRATGLGNYDNGIVTLTGQSDACQGGAASIFVGNVAGPGSYGGGAISAEGVDISGGAIFSRNISSNSGGAIHARDADLSDVLFYDNKALDGSGGGIYAQSGGALTISSSTFLMNYAVYGGGGIYSAGETTVSYSSIIDNTADNPGGGIYIAGSGTLDLVNSYVGGNAAYAGGGGGGIYAMYDVSLRFSTLYDDSSATGAAEIYIRGNLTAVGSVVGNDATQDVMAVFGTIDDTDSVNTNNTLAAFSRPAQNFDDTVPLGGLGLALRDDTEVEDPATWGRTGRTPLQTSPLALSVSAGGFAPGTNPLPSVVYDQLGAVRAAPFTLGSRQLVAPAPPPPPNPPPPNPPSFEVPSAPVAVRATAGDRSADVSWGPPSSSGSFPVTTYRVVASPGGQACLATAPARSCVVTGLSNGTTYTFTVEALNGAGWSPQSAPSNPVVPSVNPQPPGPEPLPGPLSPGQSSLVVDDSIVPGLAVTPNAQDNGLDVAGPGFTMTLGGLDEDGKPLPLSDRGVLVLDAERDVSATGSGFEPGSLVGLYIDPPGLVGGDEPSLRDLAASAAAATFLGTVTVAQDGTFSGAKTLPEAVLAGDHVIQAVGFGPGGALRSVNLGIEVRAWIALDKGKRVDAGRYDRIRTSGDTGGVADGAKLAPYIRSRGHEQFTKGKATIAVKPDGTFTWSRKIRSQKALAAYVAYRDVRSNTVVWARVR